MATYPKGKQWQANFTINGARYRKEFATEAEAEAWELQARAAIKLGKPVPEAALKKVGGGDAGRMSNVLRSAELLHWQQLRKGGEKSVFNANAFVEWVGPNTSDREALTIESVREFLKHRISLGNSTNTLNKYISAISVLMRYSSAKPFDLPWYKHDWSRARKRFFSPEQEQKVIALLTRWGHEKERDLFIFLNDTGLRPWAEAMKLSWRQVKAINNRSLMATGIVGKSGQTRDVPVSSRATVAIERQDYTLTGPWTWANEKTLNDLWQRVRGAIPELDVNEEHGQATVWYTCRHTFASRLIQDGVSYGNVAQLMDNSVEIIRRVYGHLEPQNKHDIISVLERYDTQGTSLSLVKKPKGG